MSTAQRRTRYHFAAFTLSPGQRALLRGGRVVPIIPRYLDLLLLLVAKRHEAVHRREILDLVAYVYSRGDKSSKMFRKQ